jgi:hypothetical protein
MFRFIAALEPMLTLLGNDRTHLKVTLGAILKKSAAIRRRILRIIAENILDNAENNDVIYRIFCGE